MRLAPKGHARLDPSRPQAFGYCDVCKFLYVRDDLRIQVMYAGKTLIQTNFLACPTCWDEPNPQGIAVTVPADPVPISNPRRND